MHTCIHGRWNRGGWGVPFFAWVFFFFFDESFNSFNLLLTPLCMICWMIMFCGKRTKLLTRRSPIWIRQGVLLINFLKKNNAIVLCFWYKIVPWMISLCRTPWKEVQIKTHHIQNYNHRFLLGKYSTTVVVHTVAKKIK